MRVLIVRHAKAGRRESWDQDDELRPLDPGGVTQAKSLAQRLVGAGITKILSSPYLRCIETVQPLGESLNIQIETDDRLREDTDFEALSSFLASLETEGVIVACTHGNVATELVEILLGPHLEEVDYPLRCAKASLWDLDLSRGKIMRATYVEGDSETTYITNGVARRTTSGQLAKR